MKLSVETSQTTTNKNTYYKDPTITVFLQNSEHTQQSEELNGESTCTWKPDTTKIHFPIPKVIKRTKITRGIIL